VFKRAFHLSLFSLRCIQSRNYHPAFLRSVLFIPSMPSPSEWPVPFWYSNQNDICISHLPHACYIARTSHPLLFDHPINIWWSVLLWSSSLCSLLQSPDTSLLLGPYILLDTLFCNTPICVPPLSRRSIIKWIICWLY